MKDKKVLCKNCVYCKKKAYTLREIAERGVVYGCPTIAGCYMPYSVRKSRDCVKCWVNYLEEIMKKGVLNA